MKNNKLEKELKTNGIQFNFEKIPKEEVEKLARTILKAVKEFYKDPKNVVARDECYKNGCPEFEL